MDALKTVQDKPNAREARTNLVMSTVVYNPTAKNAQKYTIDVGKKTFQDTACTYTSL